MNPLEERDNARRRWLEAYLGVSPIPTPTGDAWDRLTRDTKHAHSPSGDALARQAHEILAFGIPLDALPSDSTFLELAHWTRAVQERSRRGLVGWHEALELERSGIGPDSSGRMTAALAHDALVTIRAEKARAISNTKRRALWASMLGETKSTRTDPMPPSLRARLAKYAPLPHDLGDQEAWAWINALVEREEKHLAEPKQLLSLLEKGIDPDRARSMTRLAAIATLGF